MAGPDEKPPVLEFDHNVIEHLGIKLYANKPVNVLAELVSNCWDADSEDVEISLGSDINGNRIVVADNGNGMSIKDIRERYLIVGKQKRRQSCSNGQKRYW